jgi:putative flippase GtrA
MMQQFKSRQFLVFLLTGGFAAAVNFGSRILYNQWVSFSTAMVLAYITGMITAFVVAKLFVFKETKQDVMRSAMWFILVNLLAVAQTLAISMALAYYVLPVLHVEQFRHEIAHAVGIMIPVFTSYLGHKHFSFK